MNWGSATFDDLIKLRDNIDAARYNLHNAGMQKFCEDCAKELAARLLGKVIPRTPVWNAAKVREHLKKLDSDADGNRIDTPTATATLDNGKKKSYKLLARGEVIYQQYWQGRKGGTLRRGWTAKTEQAAAAGEVKGAKEFASSLPIRKEGDTYIITVQNVVRYASYVEHGHRQTPGRYVPQLGVGLKRSWVPGNKMLTISENELRGQIPGLLDKKLTAFLQGVFDIG